MFMFLPMIYPFDETPRTRMCGLWKEIIRKIGDYPFEQYVSFPCGGVWSVVIKCRKVQVEEKLEHQSGA